MNESNDDLNEIIDGNLRDAHRQVHFRPEWAARVLSDVANELTQHSAVKLSHSTDARSTKFQLQTAALAAGLLVATVTALWVASQSNLVLKKHVSNDGIAVKSEPDNSPIDVQAITQPTRSASVQAAPGYLACKLADEPEFEIYVVLPTLKTNEPN